MTRLVCVLLLAGTALLPIAAQTPGAATGIVLFEGVRLITGDAAFGGVEIKAGDRIMLLLPAGNLDGAVFARPDQVVIDRGANTHLSFNSGPHRCVGSHLAR